MGEDFAPKVTSTMNPKNANTKPKAAETMNQHQSGSGKSVRKVATVAPASAKILNKERALVATKST